MSDLTPNDAAQARDVADRFLEAVRTNDKDTAQSLLVSTDDGSVDMPGMSEEEKAGYELGEATIEGETVVVESRLWRTPPGETEVDEQEMPLILRREGDDWKVDIGASIERMMGFSMEDMAQGLGEALSEGMQAIAEGIGEAFGGEAEGQDDREGETPQLPPGEHPSV